MKRFFTAIGTFVLVVLLMPQDTSAQNAQVVQNSRRNTSRAIRTMPIQNNSQSVRAPYAIPNKWRRFGGAERLSQQADGFVDPIVQREAGQLAADLGVSFDGSSDDDNAAILGYRVVPPDTDGDVGPNHYVQWINSVSEIFNKDGTTAMGPFPGNLYFDGLGGICESENDGDPIVLYDERADRWLVSQFAVPGPTHAICIAISTGPDPTGTYHQYEFNFGSTFPDYPKIGVWGDSYIMTTRDFGSSWAGISAIAMDRTAMLAGNNTTMVRFANAFTAINDGAIPGDADGAIVGPALFGAHGDDGDTTFELWELDVNWSNPGAATFSSIPGVGISAYDGVAPKANQPNGQGLDDLSWFTMHRLNVRDFGTHISMVANHTVEASPGVLGVRWYEFRKTGSNWTLYQEGTVSPNGDDRWMGSIAINADGDISLGYSRSSASLFPSIYFTGQTSAGSGTGIMDVAETLLHAGGGAQSANSRWGDYSMMSVDPVDGSFWFTTEYYAATGSFDFNTRIANFGLGTVVPPTSVYVSDVVEGTQSAPKGKKRATATVTVLTNTGSPVSGYEVSGTFSGSVNESVSATTNGSGVALLVTNGTARSKGFNESFCINDVVGGLSYTSDPAYACETTGTATAVHVQSISTGTQGAGGGQKFGTATITILDNAGGSAAGYSVAGQFTGSFNGSFSGTTASNGTVSFTSTNTLKGKVNVDFCVSNVSGGLPYDAGANGNPSFACGTNAPNVAAKARGEEFLLNLEGTIPDEYILTQNYPNPFSGTSILSFAVPKAGQVSIKVYNMQGREVATVVNDFREAGVHRVTLDGSGFSAGVYLYVMQSGDFRSTRRMTLIK